MKEMKDKSRSRRNFLGSVVRGAALGAIAIISAVLVRRRLRSGQKCLSDGFCRDCRRFDDCKLPQAMTIKREPRITRIKTNYTNKNKKLV